MSGDPLLKKGISLERLHAFASIVSNGSIVEAAKSDPTRQSLLSRQVKELESTIEITLLDRSTTPHPPTEAGRKLARLIQDFSTDFRDFVTTNRLLPAPILIASNESLLSWFVIPRLKRLIAGDQSLQIELHNLRSPQAADSLRTGKVDFVIHHSSAEFSDFESTPIGHYGVKALVPHSKKIRSDSPLSWGDLPHCPLALLGGSGKLSTLVKQLAGETPNRQIIHCASYNQVVRSCAELGALAILPEIACLGVKPQTHLILDLKETLDFKYDVRLFWKKSRLDKNLLLGKFLENLLRSATGITALRLSK
ncbi:MAG: hypothetical protein RLZZ505_2050 [Verrucomicrobiota bacterium]|jgi:DNA-binding transcriptional LysR family regulator